MRIKNCFTERMLIFFLFFWLLTSSLSIIAMGQPVISDLEYTPKNPEPLSIITFSATVTGDNPTVYVFVEECRGDLCYADVQNVTMTKIDSTHYKKAITLKHGDANNVHYRIIVESKGNWYRSTLDKFNLGKDDESIFPSAGFVYSPSKPFKSDIINFTDTSTILEGKIVAWKWEFGDGEISYGQNTQHQFNKKGNFTVTLTVEDNEGKTDSYSLEINVREEDSGGIPGFGMGLLIISLISLIVIVRKRR